VEGVDALPQFIGKVHDWVQVFPETAGKANSMSPQNTMVGRPLVAPLV